MEVIETQKENDMAIRRKKTALLSETIRSDRKKMSIEISMTSDCNIYCGIGRDIGNGGVFISTGMPFYIGEELIMSFRLPGMDKEVNVSGVVQWLREFGSAEEDLPAGIGVKFKELDPEITMAIVNFVQHRDPEIYE